MSIVNFFGEYNWLSNSYTSPLDFGDIVFPSVEHAFQAAKTDDRDEWVNFTTKSASTAYKKGKSLVPRANYTEQFQLAIMYELIGKKFTDHLDLKQLLLATGDERIFFGNHWGETFWGVSDGIGDNHLGKIIMRVRKELG